MLQTSTYQIKPYLLLGTHTDAYIKPGTEWIRDVVKGFMHHNSNYLHQLGIDTSLFHNHNESTSQTLIRYPLILYHYTNEHFFVTGINQGATALQQLFGLFKYPVQYDEKIMVTFNLFKSEQVEITNTDSRYYYKINNWLALDTKTHKQYIELPATKKIELLNETLYKHIVNDLFKYLAITIPEINVEIFDFIKLDQKLLPYKNHFYLPFNLVFSTDFLLPDFLSLGNGKAFGYGIIEQIKSNDNNLSP